MNSRTIVYKGMFLVGQLRTSLAIFRARITSLPLQWYIPVQYQHESKLGESTSEPFIVHNGEINTIRGNADKMLAREEKHGVSVSEG